MEHAQVHYKAGQWTQVLQSLEEMVAADLEPDVVNLGYEAFQFRSRVGNL